MTVLSSFAGTKVAAALGWTILHSLWQGAAIAAVLVVILRIVRSASARYIAACIALAILMAAFLGTLILALPGHSPSVGGTLAAIPRAATPLGEIPALPLFARATALLPWAAPFWIVGVFAFAVRGFGSWFFVRRLRSSGVCALTEPWRQRVARLATRLGVQQTVAVLQSCLTDVPVVLGHPRPVILIPAGILTGLPEDQIEAVLLHELAHILRRDYLVNLLQTCVECLLFYHPASWWISKVVRTEREHCCDDLAIAAGSDARRYAGALTALEEFRGSIPQPALGATGGVLVKRIERLLRRGEATRISAAPFVVAAILIAATTLILTAKPQDPARTADMSTPWVKWVQEDVAYIITDVERTAYERLTSDAERVAFIHQFWLRRDPTPGTPENEFMEEHYRRIAWVNQHFHAATGLAGWKTDRGRIYIQYGPPDEIDAHPNGGGLYSYPYEQWGYKTLPGIGRHIRIDFVDPERNGELHMTLDPNPQGGVFAGPPAH